MTPALPFRAPANDRVMMSAGHDRLRPNRRVDKEAPSRPTMMTGFRPIRSESFPVLILSCPRRKRKRETVPI